MSTQIDERVVRMRFDNQQFEKNVSVTMSTLEKFRASLNFKGAITGMEEINKASKGIKLGGLIDSAGEVEVRFNAMSIAAIAAIQNIVDSAMSAGKQIVKGLTLDQVSAGFTKYTQKTEAVQTIMNATGKSVEYVTGRLEKLQWFTDETSYSFTDMVQNIAKFTSQDVELDDALSAMEGIALAAAHAGVSTTNAGRAMEAFSKSLGRGYVMLQEWRSLQALNFDTTTFRNRILETAAAMGTINKVGDKMYQTLKGNTLQASNLSETLREGWLTKDVLTATLKGYSEYADALHDLQREGESAYDAMERLGDMGLELGFKAFKAGQEAKTFTDAIGAVKDAVSTGWMQTFEFIFGNYEESVELWSSFTDVLLDIFASGASERNQTLKEWKDAGGRDVALEALANAWEAILSVIRPVKQAFEEMFPALTGQRLLEWTEKVRDFTEQLKLSEEASYTLKVAFKALMIPIKVVINLLKVGFTIFTSFTLIVWKLIDAMLAFPSKAGIMQRALRKIFGDKRYERIASAFATTVEKLRDAFGGLATRVKEALGKLSFDNLASGANKLKNYLAPLGNVILDKIVGAFEAIANIDFNKLASRAQTGLGYVKKAFEKLRDFIVIVKNQVVGFFGEFAEVRTPGEFIDLLIAKVIALKDQFLDFAGNLGLNQVLDGIKERMPAITSAVEKFTQAVKDMMGRLTPAKILIFAFGVALTSVLFNLSDVAKAATSAVTSFTGIMKALQSRLNPNKYYQLATSITIVASALGALALLEPDRLIAASKAMVVVMSGLTVMLAAMGLVNKFFLTNKNGKVMTEGIRDLGNAMIALSGSVAILAGALLILNLVDLDGIWTKLAVVVTLMTGLVVAAAALGKQAPKIGKGAIYLIAFALAIDILVNALRKIADANMSGALGNLAVLLTAMGMLALISKAASQVKFTNAAGLGLMILEILAMVGVLKLLAAVKIEPLLEGIVRFIPIFTAFGALAFIIRIAGQQALAAGVGILAMSAAILLLKDVLESLQEVTLGSIAKGLVTVGALMYFFSEFRDMFRTAMFTDAVKVGIGLIGMATAIRILGTAIKYIGQLSIDTILKGTAVVWALMEMFSIIVRSGKEIKGAMGALGVIVVGIGVLTAAMALLMLIPAEELFNSAKVLVSVMLAFAALIKSTEKIKIGNALATAATLALFLGELALVFKYMGGIDGANALKQAGALALVLASIAISTRLMTEIDKGVVEGLKSLGIVVAAVAGVIGIIGLLMLDDTIKKAIENGVQFVEILGNLSLTIGKLILLAAGLKLLGAVAGSIIAGSIAFGVSIAAIAAIIYALGSLVKDPSTQELITRGATAFKAIGDAIGGFFGSILSGFTNALLSVDIEGFGKRLYEFSTYLKYFAANLGSIDRSIVSNVANVVEMASMLSSAAFLDWLRNGFGGQPMDTFGRNLSTFAGYFAEFAEKIDGITPDKVTAAANAAKTLAEFANNLPSTGLFSTTIGLADFGQELADFGNPFAEFCRSVVNSGITSDTAQAAKWMAEAIGAFMTSIPRNGVWIDGTALAVFADDLEAVGAAFSRYYTQVSKITDYSVVDKSVAAAKSIAAFANELPGKGGILQDLAGTKSLSDFAYELLIFGPAFKRFAASMSDVDTDVVKKASAAASSVAEFANKLPGKDGFLQTLAGSKSLSDFAYELVLFGPAFRNYSQYMEDVDPKVVTASSAAAESIAALANKLPSGGGWVQKIFGGQDIGSFGEKLRQFGAGLYGYSHEVDAISFDKVDQASASVERIVNMSETLDRLNTDGMANFRTSIGLIAEDGVNSFVSVFMNSDQRMAASVRLAINKAVDNIEGSLDKVESAAHGIIVALTAGLENGKYILQTAGMDMGTNLNTGLRAEQAVFMTTGAYLIDGLVAGMNAKRNDLRNSMVSVVRLAVTAARYELGIASPSKVFKKIGDYTIQGFIKGIGGRNTQVKKTVIKFSEDAVDAAKSVLGNGSDSNEFSNIGQYMIEGLAHGIEDNTNVATDGIIKMGEELLESIQDFYGIHSPSTVTRDEVGRYIVDGIAEGIKTDMSAEESAEKKAQNIVRAFQAAIDEYSKQINTSQLEMQLWAKMNKGTSEYAAYTKGVETLTKRLDAQGEIVRLANAEYQATLREFGAEAQATQDAYNKFLQEQINLASVVDELNEAKRNQREGFTNSTREYLRLISENSKMLQEAGFSEDEIKQWAQEQSGYDPTANMKQMAEGMLDVKETIAKFTEDVEVVINKSVVKATKSGARSASASVSEAGTSVGTTFTGGIDSAIEQYASGGSNGGGSFMETVKENLIGKGSFAEIVDNVVSGFSGIIDKFGDIGSNSVTAFLGKILSGFDINSPSKVMQEQGTYVAEGFNIGVTEGMENTGEQFVQIFLTAIEDSQPQVMDAITNLFNVVDDNLQTGFRTSEEMALEMIQETLKNVVDVINSSGPLFYNEGYTLGAQIAYGITTAITDSIPMITSAVVQATTTALEVATPAATTSAINTGTKVGTALAQSIQAASTETEINISVSPIIDTSSFDSSLKALSTSATSSKAAATSAQINAKSAKESKSDEKESKSVTNNYTFNQTNTSPKALNNVEIYRESKNLFSQLKEATRS